MDFGTFEIAAWSLGMKLLTCAAGIVLVGWMEVLHDRVKKVRSEKAFDVVENDPRAVADFFGWRILAYSVLVGLILS